MSDGLIDRSMPHTTLNCRNYTEPGIMKSYLPETNSSSCRQKCEHKNTLCPQKRPINIRNLTIERTRDDSDRTHQSTNRDTRLHKSSTDTINAFIITQKAEL